jgi:alpha-beta hydrolase superfamily lysophospholipase
MLDVVASEWRSSDALRLVSWHWPEPATTVGRVLLVHGLGEHARRYDAMAQVLTSAGWAVSAYDQRGHGRSPGRRGDVPVADALVLDLAAVWSQWCQPGLPQVVMGHSLGGLVVADWVSGALAPLSLPRGVVLSSPALGAQTNLVQRLLLRTLPRWFAHLCVGNGLDASLISHDSGVVSAYQSDALVHDRIAAGLAAWIMGAGTAVRARAALWPVPTLLQYAGADALVDPQASALFASAAAPLMVQAHAYAGAYHEIYNELAPWRGLVLENLLATLSQWSTDPSPAGVSASAPQQPT